MRTGVEESPRDIAARDQGAGAVSAVAMTLVVVADAPYADLQERLRALEEETSSFVTEIIVSCEADWVEAPPGVRVVVTSPGSRGDRLDRASESAQGELLAFIDQDAKLPKGWQARAIQLMRDPTVAAVGGPELLAPEANDGERAAFMLLSSRLSSGPVSLRYQERRTQWVKHLPSTNLVVRRRAFEAAGGFQCPSPIGEDTRLCYKLRELLALRLLYDPGLAVQRRVPALPGPFLSLIFHWGRGRGDLTRRLGETSTWIPYGLPAAALVLAVLAMGISPFSSIVRLGILIVVLGYAIAGVSIILGSHRKRAGLMAAACVPLFHLAYASGFWRGYLGRSLGEVSPGRLYDRPLRVLILERRDITHPWAGGAQSYMYQLARRWVRAGCDVGWLSARYRGAKRLEVIDGIRFYRVGGQLTVFVLAPFAYLIRLRRRYDVVIDSQTGLPFFTPLFSRKPRVLLVHMFHSELFRRELSRSFRWFALWLEGWLMPRVYGRTSLVTVSSSTLSDLVDHGYDRELISIISNGVDVPDRAPADRSPSPLLVHLGRLRPYKSVDVLLRAMPPVIEKFPEARLAIVGQGPDRERLERLAWKMGLAQVVRFYGYVSATQRDELVSRAWISVCPSALEGWGLVCLEANAFGTPVIAARVRGLQDSVLDGITGVLVPYGDSKSLAKELITLLGNDSQRASMGKASILWAKAHSWDRSAEEFLETLAKIRSNGRGRVQSPPNGVKEPATTN